MADLKYYTDNSTAVSFYFLSISVVIFGAFVVGPLDVQTGQSLHLSCGLEPLHVSKVTTAGLGAANDEDGVPVINKTNISGGEKYWDL